MSNQLSGTTSAAILVDDFFRLRADVDCSKGSHRESLRMRQNYGAQRR